MIYHIINKKRRPLAYFLLFVFLLPSCNTLYLSTTLQQSVDNGPVKITYQEGQKISYEKVAFSQGQYYGEKLNSINEPKSFFVLLDTTNIKAVAYESKVNIAWLKTEGQRDYIKGVLYAISDSLVYLGSSTRKADYRSGNFKITGYPINQIEKIKLRPYGKIGAIAGIAFLSAALISGILYGNSGGDGFLLILVLIPLTAISTIVGTGIGAKRRTYVMEDYSSVELEAVLREYCINR